MERRAYERIPLPSRVQVKFLLGNMIYPGVVTNISESGMFIGTKLSFPVGTEIDIAVILPSEEVLKIPVKVRRTITSDAFYEYEYHDSNGMGVEVLTTPHSYQQFVSDLRNTYYC